jgi:hypothetical protein
VSFTVSLVAVVSWWVMLVVLVLVLVLVAER